MSISETMLISIQSPGNDPSTPQSKRRQTRDVKWFCPSAATTKCVSNSDRSREDLVKLMGAVHAHAAPSEDLACLSLILHETFPDSAVVAYQYDASLTYHKKTRRVVGAVYEKNPSGEWFLKVYVSVGARGRRRAIARTMFVADSVVGHRSLVYLPIPHIPCFKIPLTSLPRENILGRCWRSPAWPLTVYSAVLQVVDF